MTGRLVEYEVVAAGIETTKFLDSIGNDEIVYALPHL